MNYRHIFHAGNFSDVIKHYVLTLCLEKLRQKNTPFCVIDVHAGVGHYDLRSTLAQKTKEFERGIELVLKSECIDPSLEPYLDIVKSYNADNQVLQFYPGSPLIARHFLRHQDRLLLSELHPVDAEKLNDLFRGDSKVRVFNQDAYISLKSLLPPQERRGLILIDPPFEKRDEFANVVKGIKNALARFAHGMYLIWFPIKDPKICHQFYEQLQHLNLPKTLLLEFFIQKPYDTEKLNGCGLVVINSPWQMDETLKKALPSLQTLLSNKEGHHVLRWLALEQPMEG